MNMGSDSAWKTIKDNRRLMLLSVVVALVGSTVVSLSIPSAYASRTRILLEADDALYNPLSEELSRMGVDFSVAKDFTSDPFVYDKILHTPSFLIRVGHTLVRIPGKDKEVHLIDYVTHHEPKPWWQIIERASMEERIARHIKCSTDLSTGIITIQAETHDAQLSKALADSVTQQLQTSISHYRRERASQEVSKQKEALAAVTAQYQQAKKALAAFRDAHYGNLSPAAEVREEDLERESARMFNEQEQAAQRLKQTEIIMGKQSAAFTLVEESVVPVHAARPHWVANFLVWLFYAGMLTLWYVLYIKRYGRKK